ncbi:type II toxin-antitoxin system Phd/YefM family antitoxin [Saccharothrix deserti]|uniref:type II toxin-antitoxin system Phd/YefM family antitoxin n=1 Tax=Saccharothrix deserti TaxID=2593674 RepID=UPI00131A6922|nr:type II toxin-antitoxin system prevent-host-death family antitoxin [Saccharothrix deserti]
MDRIGLRELRHHTSEYVRRAQAGERIAVTDHGRVVAEIGPPGDEALSVRDQLVANGVLLRGRGRPFPKPLPPATGTPISEVLRQMREDERW